MKLQTTTDRYPVLTNSSILDMTQDLMHAREELMQTGIEMSAADRLVDDLLLGLDIVQNYGKHEGVQATMECLETIVSRTEVNIEESCEGLGSAIKAAWDKFIEICKTIFSKIKEVFGKLKNWLFNSNDTNNKKTKQLKDRAKAYKPGKESLSAGLEMIDGTHEKFIGHRLPAMALKFAKCVQNVIAANVETIRLLRSGITALGTDPTEKCISKMEDACGVTYNKIYNGADNGTCNSVGKIVASELFGSKMYIFEIDKELIHDIFSTDKNSEDALKGWDQSFILQALECADKIGRIVTDISASSGRLSNIQDLSTIDENTLGRIKRSVENLRYDNPDLLDDKTVAARINNDRKTLFVAKCGIGAIRKIASSSVSQMAELPKLHYMLNREIEKVMNALGY